MAEEPGKAKIENGGKVCGIYREIARIPQSEEEGELVRKNETINEWNGNKGKKLIGNCENYEE